MTATRAPVGPPGLHAEGLALDFGGPPVVRSASIDVRPGRITALIGANGSGKSTLLRALARLHPVRTGEVRLGDGTAAGTLSAKAFARLVTVLGQSRPCPAGVTVREVVAYGRHPHRTLRGGDPDGSAVVAWAMSVTGVADMADRSVSELSGGERQRVWLATCLAQRTGTLLLDEPTTYLDLRFQVELLDLVRSLADDHGVAVGIVLHDLQQAADLADEVVLLAGGQVLARGAPQTVMTSEHLTRAFDIRIDVQVDPTTGALRVTPVGHHTHRRRPPAITPQEVHL